jgi:hypothetical protein
MHEVVELCGSEGHQIQIGGAAVIGLIQLYGCGFVLHGDATGLVAISAITLTNDPVVDGQPASKIGQNEDEYFIQGARSRPLGSADTGQSKTGNSRLSTDCSCLNAAPRCRPERHKTSRGVRAIRSYRPSLIEWKS